MEKEHYKRHLIKAYLDDAEYERFTSIARRTNSTNSHLVRCMLRDAIFIKFPPMDFKAMVRELSRIGINMNQLASKAHSLGFIDRQEYESNAKQVMEAVGKVVELYIECGTKIEEEKRKIKKERDNV